MANLSGAAAGPDFAFGPFRLVPSRRLLLDGETPVQLGSRALEILITLLERRGELVSKDELIARAWPKTHVSEGNLKFQIAALRRALGDGRDGRRYLETSPGRGYRFVEAVTAIDDMPSSEAPPTPSHLHNLPARVARLFGRTELVASLACRLKDQRLLTIVGPGGIGKTSVAIATAEALVRAYEDGVWLVDLSGLADASLVHGAVGATVGLGAVPHASLGNLVAALRPKRMLIILDNCAHLVDAAAALADAVLRGAPGIRLLATSREPLRIQGEHVHRLGPLESPPASARVDAAEALRFPAVQLFVDQAISSAGEFELCDEDAGLVGEICRKLDGIPLAIEFASARVGVLGVRGLAARLDDCLRVLTGGHRTALARHHTMRATLDLSYGLLTAPEQMIFARVAVFAGGFTLAAAVAVATDADHASGEIVDLVLELATKSMVVADANGGEPHFRLLDTTRAYALEKLAESGEREAVARRHAEYYQHFFAAYLSDSTDADETFDVCAPEIDNLRAALAWAFGPGGDVSIGVRLAADSTSLWASLSSLAEGYVWKKKAIAALDDAGLRGSRQEMSLQAALGVELQFVKGAVEEAHAAMESALEIAERVGDLHYQLRILHAFWVYHLRHGEVKATLVLSRRAEAIAASIGDPVATATADRMLGTSLHTAGEHGPARLRLERVLRNSAPSSSFAYIRRFGYDHRVVTRYVLTQLLWVQGFADQAAQVSRATVEQARLLQHPLTLCGALAWAGAALSVRIGNFAAAEEFSAELVDCADKYSLADYHTYGVAVQRFLALQRGASILEVEVIHAALRSWRAAKWHIYLTLSEFATVVANAGHVEEVSAIVDEALERAERNQELWALPEALRVKGQLLLSQKADGRPAEECFKRSLDLARAQAAPAWELRTAISLAGLMQQQGRTAEARDLLGAAYSRFTEGFETYDLKLAKQLFDELANGRPARPRKLG